MEATSVVVICSYKLQMICRVQPLDVGIAITVAPMGVVIYVGIAGLAPDSINLSIILRGKLIKMVR